MITTSPSRASRCSASRIGVLPILSRTASACSDNTDAENALGLGIDEEFGEAFGAVDGNGASGGGPGEFRDGDFAPLFFGLGLGESGPGNFGIGEDDGGDGIGLEGNFVSGDGFDGGAAFMHCLVGEHGFSGDVADGVDGRLGGLALLVDFDESLGIDFDLRFVEAGDFGVGTAADGH